jgi:hypothetical protein
MTILKSFFGNAVCELDQNDSGHSSKMGFCTDGDEPSGSVTSKFVNSSLYLQKNHLYYLKQKRNSS